MQTRPIGLEPAPGRLGPTLLAAAAGGLALDAGVRAGVAALAGTATAIVVSAALLACGRMTHRTGRIAVAAVPLFAVWLTVRTSPWVLVPDLLAASGLLLAGVVLARSGDPFDLTIPAAVQRVCHAAAAAVVTPVLALTARPVRTGPAARWQAAARGAVVAAPVVVVLGALLASGDAVFASFLDIRVDPSSIGGHAVLVVAGAWATAGLVLATGVRPPDRLPPVGRRLGTVEATVVLTAVVVVYAGFAVAQLVALSDAGHHVLRTAGLTYAEYARSGFFQLLAAAALTGVVLLGLRAVAEPGDGATRRRLVMLAEAAVALTLVAVVVALRRLGLYEDVFGLTMLRLAARMAAWWVAVTLVLLGVSFVFGRDRSWFPAAAVAAGLVALLAWNVADPEAIVARRNTADVDRTARFDPGYLADLSDDAVPSLVDALPRLPPDARDAVLTAVCARDPSDGNWAAWNLSRQRADDARARVCG